MKNDHEHLIASFSSGVRATRPCAPLWPSMPHLAPAGLQIRSGGEAASASRGCGRAGGQNVPMRTCYSCQSGSTCILIQRARRGSDLLGEVDHLVLIMIMTNHNFFGFILKRWAIEKVFKRAKPVGRLHHGKRVGPS